MNIITIAGRVGKEPELRHTQAGEAVLGFSVADDMGKDKGTIWWRCNLWGKRADTLAQYITKGSSVTVVGQVAERKWADKDGQERVSMEVRVNDIALQGGKPQGQSSEPRQATPRTAPAPASGGFEDMDDDIPF